MYPEIRLIGRIEKVEDNSPNPYERTISLKVMFRNETHGAFRVRTPLAEAYNFCVGDEVFVSGELDELGSIHPHRFGVIRKLVPIVEQPKLSATQADAQKTAKESDETISSAPSQNASLNEEYISRPNKPPTIQPASNSIPRSTNFLFKGNARFGSSNMKAAPQPSPVSATQPESKLNTQSTTSTNAAIRSFTNTNNQAFQSNASPKPPSRTSATFNKPNTGKPVTGDNASQKHETSNEYQPDLAEYLQNEIPW